MSHHRRKIITGLAFIWSKGGTAAEQDDSLNFFVRAQFPFNLQHQRIATK